MANTIEKAQHHRIEDDVLLKIKHKEYRACAAYAKGLFHFAVQSNLLGPIRQSFDKFIAIWQKLPIMRKFMRCHAIDIYTRKDRIRYLFGDQVDKVFLYFIEKLMYNNHTDLLIGIYHVFCQMMDEIEHKRKLRIISAFPMNQSQLMQFQSTMEDFLKSEVMIKNEVDRDILGGFVCFTDSVKIDMSLKRDLDKLRAKILSCFEDKKNQD